MRCSIIGSRQFENYKYFKECISSYSNISKIISGRRSEGVDSLAKKYAKEKLIKLEILCDKEIIRNADQIFFFWNGKEEETKKNIELAEKYKKSFKIFYIL